MTDQRPLTREEIAELVHQYREEGRADVEWHIGAIRTPRELDASQVGASEGFHLAKNALLEFDYTLVAPTAKELLASAGYLVDEESANFGLFCRGLLGAQKDLAELQRDMLEGGTNPPAETATHQITSKETPRTTPLLSELLEQFLTSRTNSKNIKEPTLNEYRTSIADLIFTIGDKQVHQYTFDNAETFRDNMQVIPTHRNKRREYKGKTFNELQALSVPAERCISSRTISERLGYLKTYFKWLVAKGTADQNPFENVSITYEENHWPDYTEADLRAIFTSALYVESKYARKKTTRAAHWWLPLLCLYAGARPSELVQMRLQDIAHIDGILCATVIDEEDGMSAKTKAARRCFPIHTILLKLGFEDYVKAGRTAGHTRVLEGIKLGGRKAGDSASKWWNERYRISFLPEDFKPSRKVLYSFRCTYITRALNSGVELRHLQQMVGHEKSHMGATKNYDRGATIVHLKEAISKIEFDAMDWIGLAGEWEKLQQL